MDSQPVSQRYTVPACNLPLLNERIETLNKRARKLGVAEIVVTLALAYVERQFAVLTASCGENLVWIKDGQPRPQGAASTPAKPTGAIREWHFVTVTGEAPRFAGWSFVATLEPIATDDGGAVNLLQCVPGQVCPAEYRNRVGECDHCQAKRKRNQTFVVRNEQGEHRMVGRNCLRDFLGHTDPHRLAAWAEWLAELDSLGHSAEDEGFGGGWSSGDDGFNLLHVLAWTAGVISRYGWVSRSKARDDQTGRTVATADRVWHLLRRPFRPTASELREWEQEREKCQPTDTHQQDAEASREWARNFTDEQIDTNNYLANCVERVLSIEGRFGTQGLHKMIDAQGNALIWWASGDNWLAEGQTYRIEASVTKHDEYKGRKQTNLTRVTVKQLMGEAQPRLVEAIPF
jgi:hypothetical protein